MVLPDLVILVVPELPQNHKFCNQQFLIGLNFHQVSSLRLISKVELVFGFAFAAAGQYNTSM